MIMRIRDVLDGCVDGDYRKNWTMKYRREKIRERIEERE